MSDWTLMIVLMILGLLSALFSSSETALFSINKTDRSRFTRENPLSGRKVLELIDDPIKLLGAILLANLIINVFFFSFFHKLSFMKALHESDSNWLAFLALMIPVIVILVVGEVLPKIMALRFSYRWSLIVVYPVSWSLMILSPFVQMFSRFMPVKGESGSMSSVEMEKFVNLSEQKGMIEEHESTHLKDLIRFGVLTVNESMVPRADMVSFCLKDGADKLLELFKESSLTKIPVFEESPDDISEVIYLREFLKRKDDDLKKLTEPIGICPEHMFLKSLYGRMRLTRQNTFLVVDEYGGSTGIITFKDLLEDIVGTFNEDLGASMPAAEKLGEGQWRIPAHMTIGDFTDLCDKDIPRGDYMTVGGYVKFLFGREPYKDDEITDNGIRFKVDKIERQDLVSLIVSWGPEE
jgi:putative hemolysin